MKSNIVELEFSEDAYKLFTYLYSGAGHPCAMHISAAPSSCAIVTVPEFSTITGETIPRCSERIFIILYFIGSIGHLFETFITKHVLGCKTEDKFGMMDVFYCSVMFLRMENVINVHLQKYVCA